MKVKEIMHVGTVCVDDDTSVREVARIMRAEDIGAVPVSAEGELVGMITDRDIACRAVGNGVDLDRLTARAIMTKDPIWCAPFDDVEDAIALMESKKVRRLPVLEGDALVGMLSLGDISQRVRRDLSGEVLQSVSAHHA